jgi:hypothetical protein
MNVLLKTVTVTMTFQFPGNAMTRWGNAMTRWYNGGIAIRGRDMPRQRPQDSLALKSVLASLHESIATTASYFRFWVLGSGVSTRWILSLLVSSTRMQRNTKRRRSFSRICLESRRTPASCLTVCDSAEFQQAYWYCEMFSYPLLHDSPK